MQGEKSERTVKGLRLVGFFFMMAVRPVGIERLFLGVVSLKQQPLRGRREGHSKAFFYCPCFMY